MSDLIDISKLDKREVLVALYTRSKVQGMGVFQQRSQPLSIEEAEKLLKRDTYFDYLYGKVMKVDLSRDHLNPALYDRDNGEGAALSAIATIYAGRTE